MPVADTDADNALYADTRTLILFVPTTPLPQAATPLVGVVRREQDHVVDGSDRRLRGTLAIYEIPMGLK